VGEFKAIRGTGTVKVGKHVSAALAGEEIDTGLKLENSCYGRAGLTLVLAGRISRNWGIGGAFPAQWACFRFRVNLMGMGLWGFVFVALNWPNLVECFYTSLVRSQKSPEDKQLSL